MNSLSGKFQVIRRSFGVTRGSQRRHVASCGWASKIKGICMGTLEIDAGGKPLSQTASNLIRGKFMVKIWNFEKNWPFAVKIWPQFGPRGKNFKSDFKYTKIRFRRFWTTFEKKIFFWKKNFFLTSPDPPLEKKFWNFFFTGVKLRSQLEFRRNFQVDIYENGFFTD